MQPRQILDTSNPVRPSFTYFNAGSCQLVPAELYRTPIPLPHPLLPFCLLIWRQHP